MPALRLVVDDPEHGQREKRILAVDSCHLEASALVQAAPSHRTAIGPLAIASP